jgi:hypothetical protein
MWLTDTETTNVVEQLGKFCQGLFNSLDVFMPFLDFAISSA